MATGVLPLFFGGATKCCDILPNEDKRYVAILNQGRHPTAPGGAPTVEAHLLDYPPQPLYGRRLSLTYYAFLRPETKFPSLDALREQLAKDSLSAREWARSHQA